MKLLGLTGNKQAGKDTVCQILQRQLAPRKVVRLGFADALKQEIALAIGRDVRYIEEHKDNFRLIMQGWGTDFRRQLCGEDYWLRKMFHKIAALDDDTYLCVVTDVRFLNEAQLIQQAGGIVWRISRRQLQIDKHPSETELQDIVVQAEIQNTHSLAELEHEVQLTWQRTMTLNKQ